MLHHLSLHYRRRITQTDSEPIRQGTTIAAYLLLTIAVSLGACQKKETPRTPPAAPPQPKARTVEARTPPAQASYADVVERVGPGVVTIRTERRVPPSRQNPSAENPLLHDFFGGGFGDPPDPRQRKLMALGSGTIVQPDGIILTSHHVIDGAEQIQVELTDHRVFKAKVVGSDPPSDLAVLKIDAKDLDALALGDSDQVRVGDVTLAIGNPLGIGQTVTSGIISAKGRATGLSDGSFEDFLQTDAPINEGNSGCALVNTRGELIGISSQILSTSGGNIGIGFAIPSNMARNVLDQILKSGKVHRGQLGVSIRPMTPDLATRFGLSEPQGVLVNSVIPNGPAAKAGIRQGDVIVDFNGAAVTEGNTLRNRVASTAPGSKVKIGIFRDRQRREFQVTLGEYQPKA